MSEIENQTPEPAPSGAPRPHEPVIVDEPAKLNPLARLIGTLLSPGETFADINRKPSWLVPLVLCIVIGMGFWWFIFSHFDAGWHRFLQKVLEDRAAQNNTPVPAAQDVEKAYLFSKWGYTVFFGAIVTTLLCFASSGALAMGMMLMQAKTTFKKILSVVLWSWAATGLLQLVVTIASVFVRGSEAQENFNPRNLGSLSVTSLGVLLPDDTSIFLKTLAGSINVFSIWNLILLMIGLAAVSGLRKVKTSSLAPMVVGLWLVAVLIFSGLATLGGGR
jgi:hypothetical protein